MPKIEDDEPKPDSSGIPSNLGEWSSQWMLLSTTLQLAVPLWIETLKGRDYQYLLSRAKVCSDMVAEHGDNILFRSKKKGESAKAFNHLAEGVACLSFCPGGVKVFGYHWEACLDGDFPVRARDQLLKLIQSISSVLKEQKERK